MSALIPAPEGMRAVAVEDGEIRVWPVVALALGGNGLNAFVPVGDRLLPTAALNIDGFVMLGDPMPTAADLAPDPEDEDGDDMEDDTDE